jgi:hypothetical protein
MSMSLDGYVADRNDGVAEVFDWYSSMRSPSTSRRFFLAQESDSLTDSPARQSFLATRL